MIFSHQQIQEKCIEQQKPLHQVFVDLTKAFDTVNREALWKILAKIGCISTFVNIFKEHHRNMKARVTFNSQLSGEIAIANGVKQGDIFALTLFSIFFAVLLTLHSKTVLRVFPVSLKLQVKVLNLRRFNKKSEMFVELIRELLYAANAVFLAHKQIDIQNIMHQFSQACNAFRSSISLKTQK